MKRRLMAILLVLILAVGMCPCALAGLGDRDLSYHNDVAMALKSLNGLFLGTGTKPDGSPNFSLERTANRAEAIVMLVRLKGEEASAREAGYSHPFPDVPEWADACVGWAYHRGYTNGTSNKPGSYRFGSYDTVTASQFMTLALRALGYQDQGEDPDFSWKDPFPLAARLGLGEDGDKLRFRDFRRADMALISWNVLSATHKVSQVNGMPYYRAMIDFGLFTMEQWEQAWQIVEHSSYRHPMHDGVAVGTYYCYQGGGFTFAPEWRPRLILREDNTFEVYSNMGEGFYYGTGTWRTARTADGRLLFYLSVDVKDPGFWYGRTFFAFEVVDAGGCQLRLLEENMHLVFKGDTFIYDS